jgi:hypothetical protein
MLDASGLGQRAINLAGAGAAAVRGVQAKARATIGQAAVWLIADGPDGKTGLAALYRSLADVRDGVLRNLPLELQAPLLAPPVPPAQSPNGLPIDQLDRDLVDLTSVRSQWVKTGVNPLDDAKSWGVLRRLTDGWAKGRAAPQVIVLQLQNFAGSLMGANWFKRIDLTAIRDEIDHYISTLIPLKAILNYGFDLGFGAKVANATDGIFAPQVGSRLTIDVSVQVDFQQTSPQAPVVTVSGSLGAFEINLVGHLLDAVTLQFSGAQFSLAAGSKPHLDVTYAGYVIGDDLAFVQELQAYFGPSDGSGFYMQPSTAPIGIEAGYGLDLGIISFGDISFFNVSLNAAVIIPFDGGAARFRASLSRQDAPFTISAAPYGGSGFFAIEADASGIVGFEASFEYGGAGAFNYGPLSGSGRIMAGVYIRQMTVDNKRLVGITGTFYAGGSASLWIFAFTSSLYVRLGMIGSDMVGSATFTFSFSAGFTHFGFSVTVGRDEKKYSSTTTAEINQPWELAGDVLVTPAPNPCNEFGSWLVNDTSCQGADWGRYLHYFDGSIGQTDMFQEDS